MRRVRRVLLVVCLAGVAIAGIALLRGNRTPMRTLTDGRRIRVEAVTFGTNHVFTRESNLADLVYKLRMERYLPLRFRKTLHRSFTQSEQTGEETLIIWYSAFHPVTKRYVQVSQPEQAGVIDNDGCLFPVGQHRGSRPTPGFFIQQTYVRAFPRRQKTFTFRAKFHGNPAVEFTVPNPASRRFRPLKPEPIPARRTIGEFEFVLDSIEGRFENERNRFEPRFKVFHDRVDRTDWFKPLVWYLDATGNREFALCPHEPAWKVEMYFYKTRKAPFHEHEIWRIRNLKAPASGEVLELNAERQIGDLKIKPYALCGSGNFKFSNNVCLVSEPWNPNWAGETFGSTIGSGSGVSRNVELTFRTRKLTLVVGIDGLQTLDQLLIRARNEKGQAVWFASTRSAGIHPFVSDEVMEGRELELEFIAQTPVEASFVVIPPRPAK